MTDKFFGAAMLANIFNDPLGSIKRFPSFLGACLVSIFSGFLVHFNEENKTSRRGVHGCHEPRQ